MHLGAVSIRLCPRAALTAETPCGRFVRVWAIAVHAPASAAADAAAGAVTTTGSMLTSGTHMSSSIVSGGFSGSVTGMANVTLSGDSLANYHAPGGFNLSGTGQGTFSGSRHTAGMGTGSGEHRQRRRSRRSAPRREQTVTGGALFTRNDGTLISGAAVVRNNSTMFGLISEGLFGGGLASTVDGQFVDQGEAWEYTAGGAVGTDGRMLEPGINPLAALTLDRMVTGMVTTYDDVGVGVGDVGVTHYVYVDEGCPNVAEVSFDFVFPVGKACLGVCVCAFWSVGVSRSF